MISLSTSYLWLKAHVRLAVLLVDTRERFERRLRAVDVDELEHENRRANYSIGVAMQVSVLTLFTFRPPHLAPQTRKSCFLQIQHGVSDQREADEAHGSKHDNNPLLVILKADGALGGDELDVHVTDAYDVQDILHRARPLEFRRRCWVRSNKRGWFGLI